MKVTGQNIILNGISGKLGNQISFRQRKGKTIIASLPKKSMKPPTKARKKQMSLFATAVLFAQKVKEDPSLLTTYRILVKPGQSVYHATISAYMNTHGKLLHNAATK
ncbi:MAG: hypothetical protein ISS19_12215 [Bacteroidales bacterium]|nr:hypothetical protein [Bacteroidales bacterium]